MIQPYYGELLTMPTPLELSMGVCSHGCRYCFSRLNAYQRKESFQSTMNLIRDFRKRNSFTARLMQQGYPVCMSNKTDPFCESNYRETIPVVQALVSQGIDIFFQTKGGKGIDEVLSMIKSSCWYITICSEDDKLMKQIEPNAPLVSERFRLVEKLVSKGHSVCVGINPTVPPWMGNAEKFLKRIKNSGAHSVFLNYLHFNGYQRGRMSEIDKQLCNPYVISTKKDKEAMGNWCEFTITPMLHELGLEYRTPQPVEISKMFKPYQERYKCFPLFDGFANYVIANKKDGDIITFDDFINNVGEHHPEGEINLRDYIAASDKHVRKTLNIDGNKVGNFTDMLRIIWMLTESSECPQGWKLTSLVIRPSKRDGYDFEYVRDSKWNLPVLMYRRAGHSHFMVWEDGSNVVNFKNK